MLHILKDKVHEGYRLNFLVKVKLDWTKEGLTHTLVSCEKHETLTEATAMAGQSAHSVKKVWLATNSLFNKRYIETVRSLSSVHV